MPFDNPTQALSWNVDATGTSGNAGGVAKYVSGIFVMEGVAYVRPCEPPTSPPDAARRLEAHKVLVEARRLITDPLCWGKGKDSISAAVPGGWIFCARGAVYFAGRHKYDAAAEALEVLKEAAPQRVPEHERRYPAHGFVAAVNDSEWTTHGEVLAWFDRAAAKLATANQTNG